MSLDSTLALRGPRAGFDEFEAFLKTAKPREHFVYGTARVRASMRIMDFARLHSEQGHVNLVQKRVGKDFEYWAIRTSKPYQER
jgi:hypothetical protein